MKTKISWSETLRYCKMCKNSRTAQGLFYKAKGGKRLSQKEISLIEEYASLMINLVGTDNVVIDRVIPENFSLCPPPELLLHGDKARIVKRGKWVVDEITGCVLGKCDRTVTLVPNSVMLVNDLARLLKS